jgi:hypothetical protein
MHGLTSGVVGLLIDAGLYSEVHPSLLPRLLKLGALGKVTLPQLFGLVVWPTIALAAALLGAAVWYLDRVDRGATDAPREITPTPARAEG